MWVVFGGKGWIGQQFCNELNRRQISYSIPPCRMDDTEALRSYLQTLQPSRVISLIGRTHGGQYTTIDYLEQGRPQLVENIRDNLYGPVTTALVCRELGIHFTYLGTGCIFTYDASHPVPNETVSSVATGFVECSEPNFFGSSYSIVKGFTDRIMHLLGDTMLNLRIRMPINDDLQHPRNFLYKILHYEKICSIPNSMTVLPDMLPIMVQMIQDQCVGTYNMTNPGYISHNEILEMYKRFLDPTFTYQNFTLEEQHRILLSERSNNTLETKKLESQYPILSIHDSITQLFQRIAKKSLG